MGLAHDNNFDTGAHYRDWSPNIGYNAPWSLSSFAHFRAGDHFCLVVRFLLGSRLGKRKTSYKLFNFGALEASSQSADGQSCCTNVSSHSFLQHKFAAAAARNDSTQTTRTASTPGLCPRSLPAFSGLGFASAHMPFTLIDSPRLPALVLSYFYFRCLNLFFFLFSSSDNSILTSFYFCREGFCRATLSYWPR
jgi:hypothetical protein